MRRRDLFVLLATSRAFAQSPPRYHLIRASAGRWCYVTPDRRPFFPLFGFNATLEDLGLLDARAWPRVIPAPPAPLPPLGLAYRLPPNPRDALTQLRALPADHEWKSRWVDFLKERYEYSIARVNEAYALDSTSFSDLLIDTYRSLDPTRPSVRRDDLDFYSSALDQLGPVICLPDPRPARPSLWLDRFHPQPPTEIVAMRAPDSRDEAAAWLLSREKEMADWTSAPALR